MIHFYDGVPTSNQTCIVNCYQRSSFYSLPTSECFEVTYQLHEREDWGMVRGGAECGVGNAYDLVGGWSREVGFTLTLRPLPTPFKDYSRIPFSDIGTHPGGGILAASLLATMFQRKTHLGIVVGVIIML